MPFQFWSKAIILKLQLSKQQRKVFNVNLFIYFYLFISHQLYRKTIKHASTLRYTEMFKKSPTRNWEMIGSEVDLDFRVCCHPERVLHISSTQTKQTLENFIYNLSKPDFQCHC